LFNRLYFRYSTMRYRMGTADNDESIVRYSFDASFMIPPASAVCGPDGYTIQLSVPDGSAFDAIAALLKLCQDSPCYPAKVILRLHRRDHHVVSFCEDGYSLNFEFHPKKRQAREMKKYAEQVVEIAIANGGKVHLAKDHILSPSQFRRLYPRYRDLLKIKERLDPDELFQSGTYRRLFREPAKTGASSEAAEPLSDAAQSVSR
jgi:FAD/FMN-containing dehydrogenase